jgi:hypothetical protein
MASQPATLTELLKSAWAHVQTRNKIVLPAVILFMIVMTALPILIVTVFGMSIGDIDESQVTPQLLQQMFAVGVSIGFLSAVLGAFAYLFYLISAIRTDATFGQVLKESFRRFFPFLGLSILVFLRSFGWVALLAVPLFIMARPVAVGDTFSMGNPMMAVWASVAIAAGTILSIIFMPRLILAPVLWLVENLGVSAAIQRSIAVSRGYWGKIFGNFLVLNLVFMLIMMFVSIFTGIIESTGGENVGGLISSLISMFFSQYFQAITAAFLLKLAATIIINPRGNAPASAVAAAPKAPAPVKAAVVTPVASVPAKTVTKNVKAAPKAASKPASKAAPKKKPAAKKKA